MPINIQAFVGPTIAVGVAGLATEMVNTLSALLPQPEIDLTLRDLFVPASNPALYVIVMLVESGEADSKVTVGGNVHL